VVVGSSPTAATNPTTTDHLSSAAERRTPHEQGEV